MKISKCKKELARIISEHGGWRNGEFAAQDGDGLVGGYGSKPEWNSLVKYWWRETSGGWFLGWFLANKIKNHHQTVLSRAEYFHLYPALDAKPRFCESVVRSIPEPDEQVWTNPPTIDQLLQDWRKADDFAKRKQAEADEAAAMRYERWNAVQVRAGEMGVAVGLRESVVRGDRWIAWSGGGCPVPKGTLIDVRYRDGHELFGLPALISTPWCDASSDFWSNDGFSVDIVAYRLARP